MVFVPGIRRAALEARLPRSQKLSPPVRRPRRRDPHRPRHGLEILPAQQTHHHLTLAPGREPTPTAAPGGRAGRHRFLNVLPHLDTPPASTRSQSRVQENPRAQERQQLGERLVVRGDVCVLLRQELHLLGLLLQLRLQGGGVLLVLPREVGHQLREIGLSSTIFAVS